VYVDGTMCVLIGSVCVLVGERFELVGGLHTHPERNRQVQDYHALTSMEHFCKNSSSTWGSEGRTQGFVNLISK
jgi:hypothetical protein